MRLLLLFSLLILISCNEPIQNEPQTVAKKTIKTPLPSSYPITKESKIDSIAKKLKGTWINLKYLNYLKEYGTAHQALKKIDHILALSISYKRNEGQQFSIDYVPTKHGGEPFLAYLNLDSFVQKSSYQLIDYQLKNKALFLSWKNDTIQILVKTPKGSQKIEFKRIALQDSSPLPTTPFDGISRANRMLISALNFDLYSAENKKIGANLTFNSTGQVLNWAPYNSFRLSAYHPTKYLDHDQLRLSSDKEHKSIVFHVERDGKKWLLYQQNRVEFVREQVLQKGALLFILKQRE
jgi:hypothetical protein